MIRNVTFLLLFSMVVFFSEKISFPTEFDISQDIAFIPYRVENSSEDFPVSQGEEYSKLLGVASTITNGVKFYNPVQLKKDLSSYGINPYSRLTAEDLSLLCKNRMIDYVVTGNLIKTSKGYKAESLLFSYKQGQVISRTSIFSEKLFDLAVKDNKQLFISFSKKEPSNSWSSYDIVLVLDSSYGINDEFKDIKEAFSDFSREVFDYWNESRISIITFNDNAKYPETYENISGLNSLNSALDKIALKGTGSEKSMQDALKRAIDEHSWKRGYGKFVLLITNTPFTDDSFTSKYAIKASTKKIPIYTINLGKLKNKESIAYHRLSEISKGKSSDVTYKQTMYDGKGSPIYLYYEKNRLFSGEVKTNQWKNGLFVMNERKGIGTTDSPDYAKEIFLKEKAGVIPSNMADYFMKIAEKHVVQRDPIEVNISSILERIGNDFSKNNKRTSMQKPIARVLLADEGISIWSDVSKEEDLKFFEKTKDTGFYFIVGIHMIQKKDSPYGFSFNPEHYLLGFSEEHVPSLCGVKLKDLFSKPSKYYEDGLFNPPYWFIKVKTVEIRYLSKKNDIRG